MIKTVPRVCCPCAFGPLIRKVVCIRAVFSSMSFAGRGGAVGGEGVCAETRIAHRSTRTTAFFTDWNLAQDVYHTQHLRSTSSCLPFRRLTESVSVDSVGTIWTLKMSSL